MTGFLENPGTSANSDEPSRPFLSLRIEGFPLPLRRMSHEAWQEPVMFPSFEHEAAAAALRVPHGVFCLTSAARLQGLLPRMDERFSFAVAGPVPLDEFAGSVRLLRWTFPGALERGVEERGLGPVRIRLTSSARTVVDLFRYAHRPGGEETGLVAGRAFLVEGGRLRDLKEIAAATGAPASVGRMLEFLKLYQGEGVR
jgi:hypothetical protein